MPFEFLAFHTVQEQVPQGPAVLLDRGMFIERKPVVRGRLLQDGRLIIDDEIVLPNQDSPVPQAPVFVQNGRFIQGWRFDPTRCRRDTPPRAC